MRRYDRGSSICTLSNCKVTGKKFSGLQQDSSPWPLFRAVVL